MAQGNVHIRKPDALYIGLYRAGSTTLRAYFSQHPKIEWTRNLSTICTDEWQSLAPYQNNDIDKDACYIDVFEGLVSGKTKASGAFWKDIAFTPGHEIPDTCLPNNDEIAKRLKEVFPDTKIILVLREQLSWILSCYLHFLRNLPKNQLSFSDFLSTPQGQTTLITSHYDKIITSYASLFGIENMHILLLEQLIADQSETLSNLCDFLGIVDAPFETNLKAQNKSLEKGYAYDLINARGPLDLSVKRLLRKINPIKKQPVMSDFIPKEEMDKLRASYKLSNQKTAGMTGLPLEKFGYSQ